MYSLYFITFQRSGTRPFTKPLRSIRPEQRGTFHTQFWLIAKYPLIIRLHHLYPWKCRCMDSWTILVTLTHLMTWQWLFGTLFPGATGQDSYQCRLRLIALSRHVPSRAQVFQPHLTTLRVSDFWLQHCHTMGRFQDQIWIDHATHGSPGTIWSERCR